MPNYAAAHVLTPAEFNQATPIGLMILYAGPAAPDGWLQCDGSAVSRSAYADLFAAITTTYGIGDGINTFNLPDTRDRVIVCKGTTHSVLGATGGEETHVLTAAEMPNHTHTTTLNNAGGHSHTYSRIAATGPPYGLNLAGVSKNTGSTGSTTSAVGDHSHTVSLASAGGGLAHNNMQPYLTLLQIIRY